MNKEALKQILDAMKLHTAETHPLVETERAMEAIEAKLAQLEQKLLRRLCPNTYYRCGRGCGDGPCKDFDDAYDIKEHP